MNNLRQRLNQTIRNIPDFPKPGIQFKDITPIFEDAALCRDVVLAFAEAARKIGINAIAGVESRGFLFGPALAIELGVPFIIVRKKGKLPGETVNYAYALEYGTAEIEVHRGSLKPGQKVLIHDDLLATGGTAAAAAELVQHCGAQVGGFCFLIELLELNGAQRLQPYTAPIVNLISY